MTKSPPPKWRSLQKESITDLNQLAEFLELSKDEREKLAPRASFPLLIPLRLAKKIKKGDLNDPLLRQFVPFHIEHEAKEAFVKDPVSDLAFQKSQNLLHKYPGRALLVTTGACAMHCRYCFRQNFPYQTPNFEKELNWLKENKDIFEVILSGGDPLSLSDERLRFLTEQIEAIDHIKILRFHSRFIVGIPERVTEELLELLKRTSLSCVFVLHINHAAEMGDDLTRECRKLKETGATLLNQAVLLKGVNDTLKDQIALSKALIQTGITPYYLHQLDKVEGGAHFEVDQKIGLKLVEQMRDHLPGYAVPRFVREIPHKKSKTLVSGGGKG